MLKGDRQQRIIANYDKALINAEDAVIERVWAALDKASRELERQLARSYQRHQGIPGLLPNQRALLIRQEIAAYMALLKPSEAAQIESLFQQMLGMGAQYGIDMSQELINAITNTNVQSFATVPFEAIRFQAQDASKRLYRWSEEYQGKISGIVEMHLAMGAGVQKVKRALRNELGITKGRAETIARTEMISSFDSATRENYKRNDISYVQRVGTQDSRICAYCAARVGNVYKVEEAPAAIHPNDRCYNVPFNPQWVKLGLIDTEWMDSHIADVRAQVATRGESLNYGVAPFERMNRVQPPKPVDVAKLLG